ncbi:unnamed protein product [Brassica oleracea var. botrytis]
MVFKPLRPPIFKLRKPHKPLFSSPSSPRFSIPPSPRFSTPQSPDFQAPQAPCFQAPQLKPLKPSLFHSHLFPLFLLLVMFLRFLIMFLYNGPSKTAFTCFLLQMHIHLKPPNFKPLKLTVFKLIKPLKSPVFKPLKPPNFKTLKPTVFKLLKPLKTPVFKPLKPQVPVFMPLKPPGVPPVVPSAFVPFVPVVGYVPPFPAAVQNHDTLYTETPSICHFQVPKEVLFHPGGGGGLIPGVQAAQAPQAPSFQSTQALQAPGVQAPQAPNDQSLQVPGVPPVVPPAFFPFVPIVVYFPPFPDHVLIQRTAGDSFHQFSLADADHKFCSYLFYPHVSKEVLFHPVFKSSVFKPLKPPVFKPLKPPIFKLLNPLVLPPVFNPHKAPVFKFFKSLKPPVFKSLKPPVFKDFNLLKPPVFKPLKPMVFHPPLFHLFLLLVMFLRFLDKSFTFIVKTSPALGLLLKAAAEKLPDLNCTTIESAMRIIAGTAANMGIDIDPQVLEPKKKAVLL